MHWRVYLFFPWTLHWKSLNYLTHVSGVFLFLSFQNVCYCCVYPCHICKRRISFAIWSRQFKCQNNKTKKTKSNPRKKKKRIRSYLPFKTKANSHSHTNGKSWKMLKHEKDCLRAMRTKWNEKFDRRMNSWKKNYNGQIPVQTDIVRITATPCTKGEKMESR